MNKSILNNRGSKQVLKIVMVLAIAFAIPSLSMAQSFYVSPRLGYSLPTTDSEPYGNNIAADSDFPSEFNADGSFLGGIGLGYMFNKNLRVEGRFSYRNYGIDDTQFGTGARDGEEYTLDGENEIMTITLNGFYDFSNKSSFTPYVKAGLGVAFNKYSARLGGAGVAAFDPFDGKVDGFYDNYSDGDSAELAWNLGAGVSYELSKRFSIYGEYQYASFGSVSSGQDSFTDGFQVDGSSASEFVLGTRISF